MRVKQLAQPHGSAGSAPMQQLLACSDSVAPAPFARARRPARPLQVMSERDVLGSQLVRRNDELALLYEKVKLQAAALARGAVQYRDRCGGEWGRALRRPGWWAADADGRAAHAGGRAMAAARRAAAARGVCGGAGNRLSTAAHSPSVYMCGS